MSTFSIPAVVVERIGWVLVHSLWQFSLIALIVGVVLRLLQGRSASQRYGVLTASMAVLVVISMATWMVLPSVAPDRLANRKITSLPEPTTPNDSTFDTLPLATQPALPSETVDVPLVSENDTSDGLSNTPSVIGQPRRIATTSRPLGQGKRRSSFDRGWHGSWRDGALAWFCIHCDRSWAGSHYDACGAWEYRRSRTMC
jgi:hypothetical protein